VGDHDSYSDSGRRVRTVIRAGLSTRHESRKALVIEGQWWSDLQLASAKSRFAESSSYFLCVSWVR